MEGVYQMAGVGSNLGIDYESLNATAKSAQQMAEELRSLMQSMSNAVNSMCDGWTASASEVFRNDYQTLANNVNQTSTVVDELSVQVQQYVSDMQELDTSYASSKVSTS